jgi:hypothetical protein
MTPENNFMKSLEAFLDEEFNDFSRRRILSYLKEYREQIPPVIIVKKHQKEIVKPVASLTNYKMYVTKEQLMKDAEELCKINNLDIDVFVNLNKKAKSRTSVTILRKLFCQRAHEQYLCTNNILARFFNVHHSTVCFYLYGKKYISKSPNPRKIAY